MVLAVVAAALIPLQVIAIVRLLVVGPRGLVLVTSPAWLAFLWWIHRGALLRTRQARPAPGTVPPWDERGLTPLRAWWYTWLALACVVAAAIAVGLQARSWVG
jgi:hypothetical protein